MKSLRTWKWILLPILLISVLACATDRTVTQPAPTAAPSQAVPVSTVQNLSYKEEGGYTRIRLEGTEPIAPPFYHVLPNPLRIVIDLPNTDLSKIKEPMKIDNGTVGEVWATQYDDKGRIEIHLSQMAHYNISREGPVLNIDIEQATKEGEGKNEKAEPTKEPVREKEAQVTPEPAKEKETEVAPVEVKKEGPASEAPGGTPSPAVEAKQENKAKGITDISLEKRDDSVSFNIVGDGRLGNYNSFKLDSPPRLVLDLWEVDARLAKKGLRLPNPYIKEVRIGQYPGKVRLVFDSVKSPVPPYEISRLEDRIVVSFGNVPHSQEGQVVVQEKTLPVENPPQEKQGIVEPPKGKERAAPPSASAPSAGHPRSLTGIDFKQVDQKSRIIISVSGESKLESSLISKKTLAVDLRNVIVPKRLQRSLDTSEFKSAVESIQLQNIRRGKNNDTRILVKLREEVPYVTGQEGTTFFIDFENPKSMEVRETPVPARPREESPPQAVKKEEGTPEEAKREEAKKEEAKPVEEKAPVESKPPIKEPTRLTEQAPLPAPPPVIEKKEEEKKGVEERPSQEKAYSGKKISLDFKDADIKNILRLIAEVSDLNIIAGDDVSGKVTMRLVEVPWDQALEVILSARNLGMIRMGNVIRVAPLETLKREMQSELEAKRSKERIEDLVTEVLPLNYIIANSMLQTQIKSILSDRGDVRVHEQTNSLIIKDIPRNIDRVKVVLRQLDAKTQQVVIEARIVEANVTFTRDIGISWGFDRKVGKGKGEIKGGLLGNKLIDFPATPATGTAGVFQFLLNSAAGMTELDIAISAHQLNGDVRIISSPKLATLHNKEASIEQGLRIPYLKITTEGTVTTDFIEANLKLTVLPHVTNDGHVKMSIKVKKDAPNNDVVVQGVPSIDKKEAITEVLVKDNGVVVIGGIFTIDKESNTEGIPLFSKIPLLGWLFKKESKSDTRKDLLIFISPKIINDAV